MRRKIELDRRRIRTRMAKCARALHAWNPPDAQPGDRRERPPSVAIAGYTNAGKSTLLSRRDGRGRRQRRALQSLDDLRRSSRRRPGAVYASPARSASRFLSPTQLVEAFPLDPEEEDSARRM